MNKQNMKTKQQMKHKKTSKQKEKKSIKLMVDWGYVCGCQSTKT